MLIDELLLQMPYQFSISESRSDYFELTAKKDIDEEQADDLSPVGPKDKITAEIFSSRGTENDNAMKEFKEHLNLPKNTKGFSVDRDDSGDFPFLINVYRVDDKEENERKLYFLKTGVGGKYRYVAMVLIHKEITEGSGLTNSDLLSWSIVLKEHITCDPDYIEMYA